MQETRNLILAIVLSMIVLVLWQIFYVEPQRQEALKYKEKTSKVEEIKENLKSNTEKLETNVVSVEPGNAPGVFAKREDLVSKGKRIKISTGALHGSINLTGSRFDDLTLVEFGQSLHKNSPDVVLLSPQGTKEAYFTEFGWLSHIYKETEVPNSKTIWNSDSDKIVPDKPVTLTWENKQGIRFVRTITLDEHYMFTINDSVENAGNTSITLMPFGFINRAREDSRTLYISHEGPLGVFDNVLSEATYDDLKDDKNKEQKNTTGWIGIADKYWLTAIIPDNNSFFDARFNYRLKNGQNRYQSDFLGSPQNIEAGQKVAVTHRFFAGVKKVGLLDEYSEKYNIPLFDHAVDFGWLYFITKPMFSALKMFYSMLGNFGLAILMLTVLVKLILFPLANKSYKSMAQLKKVQPEIMELRERYKGDKQKLGEETMKFYRDRKINPAAGCLPILVQIPIFFALYKVLFITVEMRHAPFYGWIKDLSEIDPTSVFNLFGLLNFEPYSWLPPLGVLPLLFGATMIIQQRLNPPPADPTQAMVMRWMPFLFVFIFAGFPAGLVLYWTWNNILSIIQQWIITKGVDEQKITPVKSLKKAK